MQTEFLINKSEALDRLIDFGYNCRSWGNQRKRVTLIAWDNNQMATHLSILAGEIPWTEKLGGLQSKGSQRVRWDRGLTEDWAQLGSKMRFTWTGIYKRRFTSSVCQETQDGSLERVTTSLRMLHWPSGSSPLQMLLPVRPYRACWGLWFVWSFAQQPPLWHRQWRLHLPFQEWLPGVSSIYGLGSACNT